MTSPIQFLYRQDFPLQPGVIDLVPILEAAGLDVPDEMIAELVVGLRGLRIELRELSAPTVDAGPDGDGDGGQRVCLRRVA